MCCGSRVLGSGGRIAGNRRQNAGQPGAEWLVSVREKRATLGFARFYYLFCCLGHPAEGDQPAEGNNPAGRAGMWPTACAYLPVPTACADCLWPTAWANLPDAAKGRAGRGRGAVSRTCTGRRARWLGILPFRVCRRGLRCCGFSPLRGARILSCLSQGT